MNKSSTLNPEQDRIVVLVAHPDDEFLFMWPALNAAHKIIACVDDLTHPTRQWCRRRRDAFAEVCERFYVEGECLRHDSGFYRKPHAELTAFVDEVTEKLAGFDVIVTHNAWGEYGHLDHILLHNVARMTDARVITTDTVLQADWYKVRGYRQGERLEICVNDRARHNECMQIYSKHKAMGWTYPMVTDCHLVEVIK